MRQTYIIVNVYILTALLFSLPCFGQKKTQKSKGNDTLKAEEKEDDYYKETFVRYEDYIYKNNIKTVLLHKKDWELSYPMIELNSDDKLQLSFDDMDAEIKEYKYTVIHCNASWEPSGMNTMEYIEGFADGNIDNYKFSFNTVQEYIHYELTFPTDEFKLLKSGNYIIKVFAGNEDSIVFTKRFMVFENKVDINAMSKQPASFDDKNYKQEIDFTINSKGYQIANSYSDLKVFIQQNGRWDNIITGLKPTMIKGDELVYDYFIENVFSGGNEYRHFDIKSLKYLSDRVKKIKRDSSSSLYYVYLFDDERRTFKTYHTEKDINGKKLIKTEDAENSSIEAEYVYVHFSLPYSAPLIDGDIYIMGSLTNWNFTRQSKMTYNYEKHAYESTLYLKQGYYDYMYVFVENNKKTGDESFIEGKHYETENDYTIYVYNRETGEFYDRLIGVKQFNTAVKEK